MINISIILSQKLPNAQWSLNGDFYEGLTWHSEDIPKPSLEEIESWDSEVQSIIAKNNCKSKSQSLLNESDFTDLYSVRNKLENINEWDNYRDIIRQLRINPVENPVFPDKPQTIWKEIVIPEPIEAIVVPVEEPIINNEETTI
jgi:hypothetical protein